MKKAVIYGSGNIGRGFIGQLFHMSGYEITFIDINKAVIDRLNAFGRYPIYVTNGEDYKEYVVTNVHGIDGNDTEAVSAAVADAEIMATAVGVNALRFIAAPIAQGVARRMATGCVLPLNIIVRENMIDVDKYLSELIKAELTVEGKEYFDKNVALIEPSIGRMVPATPEEIAKREMLAVCVEPYCELPVDRAAFKGEMPKIVNMRPFSPFEFHIRRKLFMHNMSHALTAYLGNLKGYTYIWEASGDFEIRKIALRALGEVSYAMSREYGVAESELVTFGVELMERYDNKLLGDTVFRVGRDTKRKLSENDRFVGAIRLCEKHGGSPKSILLGLAAGLHFAPEGDGASAEIAANIAEKGIADTLERFCGIDRSSAAVGFVEKAYSALGKMAQNASFAEILAELGIEI